MNPAPTAARIAKARKRIAATDAGDLARLRTKLWGLLERVENVIACEGVTVDNIKLTYAFTQLGATFTKTVEVGELEARVAALEVKGDKHGA